LDIFLDMDGPLADFVGGAVRVHRRTDVLDHWPAGVYDLQQVLGLPTVSALWGPIDHHGREFWAGLQKTPWCDEIVELASAAAESVRIVTTPSHDPASLAGKLDWLNRHFGRPFLDYVMTPAKYLLAAPDRLLIDDCNENVDQFLAAGGKAILFPRPLNRLHRQAHDPMFYVRRELADVKKTPT